jgi:hypothetical protein
MKKKLLPKICCKAMDNEYKCSGCNWEHQLAYYLDTTSEPEVDPKDEDRLTNGLCAQCFIETIEGCEVKC